MCFNATLVRLEAAPDRTGDRAGQTGFNATLVRLEAANWLCIHTVKSSFNATLVRLEAAVFPHLLVFVKWGGFVKPTWPLSML